MKSLTELEQLLVTGQSLSMQGSMDRRMPDKKAIPFLLDARKGLTEYVIANPTDSLSWRLLSKAEETLLNYPAALQALEQVFAIEGKNRKALKKWALLKEYCSTWNDLSLSPEQLELLGEYLDEKLEDSECDHTLHFTREWLDQNVPKSKKSKIIKALQSQGGFCDCEVLANVVD